MIFLGFAIAICGGTIIGSFLPPDYGTTNYAIEFSITSLLAMCANITVLVILPLIVALCLLGYFIDIIKDVEKRANWVYWLVLLICLLEILNVYFIDKNGLLYRLF